MCEGIVEELCGIDLGDERLNKRSVKVLAALSANPEASINKSCGGWGDTLAAYRLFDHAEITPDKILEPHRQATVHRMSEHAVVLVAQDTTELDYTQHPPRGVRCLNTDKRFGLYHHVHLAVTPGGLPLGVVGIENFDRAPESLGRSDERVNLPIEAKESYRWLKGYRAACQFAAELPGTSIVSVADREADIYDIYVEAEKPTGPKAHYLIRVKEDRSTLERNPEAGAAAYHKVRDQVARSKLFITRTLDLPATPKRSARTATLEMRALTVQVKPPHARSSLPSVTVQVVLVEEVGGPGDGTDVSWFLITTLPISTIEEVLRIVDYYVRRWTIELYFKILKSGCCVEEIQLETKPRLENCLAFYSIIAWRILYLTYLNRTTPNLPCTVLFEDAEWKSVYRVVTQQPLPPTPPTLAEFMKLVAHLGGYNNRATERPPGPETIWTGLRRMLDFATAWLRFGPGGSQSCV